MVKVGDKIEILNAEELGWVNVVENGDIYDVISVEQLEDSDALEISISINNSEWTLGDIDITNGYVKVITKQITYESVFKDEVFKREFAVIPPYNVDK